LSIPADGKENDTKALGQNRGKNQEKTETNKEKYKMIWKV